MSAVTFPVAFADHPRAAHWENSSITWSGILEWVRHPARRKQCGNYIFATLERTEKVHEGSSEPCINVHRDNRSISRRSAILALDIDSPDDHFDLLVETALDGTTYVMHTTHSSTPTEPRYRLLVQVDRDMAPGEYVEAAKALAARLGRGQFDSGSFEATRFMFKPATRKPEWYDYWIGDGEPLSVDTLLEEYDRDLSDEPMPKVGKNKRDPFELEDPIGAFNRAYEDLDVLIAEYNLPYIKESDDRYTLSGSASEAGFGPVAGAPGLFYSHHAGDPAYGKTCSAFDLVRLHWFSELDEATKPGTPVNKLPSHVEMLAVASRDTRVVADIFSQMTSEFEPEPGEDEEWRTRITLTRQGRFQDTVSNWDLIRTHDPVFRRLYFNMLTMSPELDGDVPWRKVTPLTRTFDGIDHAELRDYIERTYSFRPPKDQVDHLVQTQAGKKRVSPIRDYLDQLVWDGVPRLETSLPGAADSRYNRLVARKVLAAAVARVYEPGLKWDHTLVLQGGEGIGKSTWIERMANVGIPERRPYHYTLGPLNSKDTLLAAHMSWIVFSDEGHSLRKADNDALKEFLTRTHDVFRMPYDRETVVHPRQFVIWSATNDETFLRRQEGNRRFLMVRCLRKYDLDSMTPEYVDQVWAEAVAIYRAGERLYLTDDEALLAKLEQNPFLEEDTNMGVIENFLDLPVPDDWWEMSPVLRIQWKEDHEMGFHKGGNSRADRTCTRQLWHEALGQRLPPTRADLLSIAQSLRELGWVSSGSGHFPGYGTQAIFVRKDDLL